MEIGTKIKHLEFIQGVINRLASDLVVAADRVREGNARSDRRCV